MDPLERDQLRRKIAVKIKAFQGAVEQVECVSAHWYQQPPRCELCETSCSSEVVVIRNRAAKNWKVGLRCLKDMVRFKVTDAVGLEKWLPKFKDLKAETLKKQAEAEIARNEERKRLERRVIVRRRTEDNDSAN